MKNSYNWYQIWVCRKQSPPGRLKEMKTLPNLCHSIYLNWPQIGRSSDCGENGLGVFQLSDRVVDGGDDEDGVTLCVMKNQMQGRIVPDLYDLKQHFLQCGFVRCRDRYFIYFLFIRKHLKWRNHLISRGADNSQRF